WYVGLGAGWDHIGNSQVKFNPNGPDELIHGNDSALLAATFGYRLPYRLRLEAEIAWSRHDMDGVNETDELESTGSESGRLTNITAMMNALYDWQLTKRWDFFFGVGAGVGRADLSMNTSDGFLF